MIKSQGIRETEEWTDEKHSMYIKSIEASFVNDLYDSKQTGNSTTGQVSKFQSFLTLIKILLILKFLNYIFFLLL